MRSQATRCLMVLLAVAGAAGALMAAPAKKESIHQQIAKFAAILATNRFAEAKEDHGAVILLQLATKLQPKNQDALLALALLEKGMAPRPIQTSVTEDKLFSVMQTQAERLLKDPATKTHAALYLSAIEHFRPKNEEVLLHLMNLRVDGVETDLNSLLEKPLTVAPTAESASTTAWDERPPWVPQRAKQCPANGKWYRLIRKTAKTTWREALRECGKMGGRLACIRDWDDNEFVAGLTQGTSAWLGGTDELNHTGEIRWRWIDWKPVVYSNWAPGEPPDMQRLPTPEEERAGKRYAVRETHSMGMKPNGQWVGLRPEETLFSFVCMWEGAAAPPPDKLLKTPYPKDAKIHSRHAYKVFHHKTDWVTARAACEAMGGYLVCIESKPENRMLAKLIDKRDYWTGGWDPDNVGKWKWLSGKPFNFKGWRNDPGPGKQFLQCVVFRSTGANGSWTVAPNWPGHTRMSRGFICEWDAASIKRNQRPLRAP